MKEIKLKINEAYAEIYNKRREKEELQKLKDKYGENAELATGEGSSSSESEDSEAEALTPEVERDWLRTLAAIKSRDPKIYDPSVTFYHQHADDENDEEKNSNDKNKNKSKKSKRDEPMFLKDYERKVITEREGRFDDEEEESGKKQQYDDDDDDDAAVKPVGYYAEQEAAKARLKAALADDETDDDDDDDILTVRKTTQEEKEKEEEEYVEWMKGRKQELKSTDQHIAEELDPLRKYWNDPSLGEDERFLRDFILNKDYLQDDEEQDDRLPTYDEILKEEEKRLAEDEKQLEKEEEFENKFNFRFEEPDAEFIKSYPRTISSSMRNKDTRRAEKRKIAKEKKDKKHEEKREELKRLKNLKKKEIIDKISRLREITGNSEVGFNQEDLEADLDQDFDPKQHDKLMKRMLGSDYYDQDDADDTKPVFNDDDEDLQYEDWDNWEGGGDWEEGGDWEGEEEVNCEHPDFNMDADYSPAAKKQKKMEQPDVVYGKKKKKSKFAEAVERKKPVYNPDERTFEQYLDEYYKLDYEDIIDDLPVRFQYRQVTPNNFGLTTDEILKATDKELNAWVSVKKMSQYRTKEEEDLDVRRFKKKGASKERILLSLYHIEEPEDVEKQQTNNKKKKKKKKQSAASAAAGSAAAAEISNKAAVAAGSAAAAAAGSAAAAAGSATAAESNSKTAAVNNKKKAKQAASNNGTAVSSNESAVVQNKTNETTTKANRKKQKKNDKAVNQSSDSLPNSSITEQDFEPNSNGDSNANKKSKQNKKNRNKNKQTLSITDERLKAYGINPKKYKYVYSKNLKEKGKEK